MNTNHQKTVGEFARSVRAQLSDLPALDVEELTEGLEADLAERLAEDGSDLGDPVAYAAELRASAGLAAKAPLPAAVPLHRSLAFKAREILAALRTHPSTVSLLDFLIALRPVWWVLRGWIVFGLLIVLLKQEWPFFPRSFFEFILWVALIIVSIQWGRGRWLGAGQIGVAFKATASVVAALLLLPLTVISLDSVNRALSDQSFNYASAVSPVQEGVSIDGGNVSNVFAYDCSGKPLHNVQLFNQDGRKLSVSPFDDEFSSYYNQERGEEIYGVSNRFASRGEGWNIFPLDVTEESPYQGGGIDFGRVQAPLPFDTVQPLLNECAPEAPKQQEAILPSTMPTAPTLDPEGMKATDAKGGESTSASPSPSQIPGTPEPGESKAPKESAKPSAPSGESSGEPSEAPKGK
ncbi:hypothetical protein [Paeniglutamicibacter kerguelensis]|uniref:Uncharacterized protein n=1 Tax=Paeniglutamicibacter kerguelensis TaxID=254788 RepID=A0ABS4XK50_9MICC|nr:hypothetical protein [Paeniglutamicibacter kerguelensis]MBP2388827.1 hypothetical protein [Paeniglutamicibacter kerguelensis]